MAGEHRPGRFNSGEFQRQKHPSEDMSHASVQFSGPFSGQFSSGEFPIPTKPDPPQGTYVVQLPKDQIYRVPPPENGRRFEYLSRRKPSRSGCRRCFCFFLAAVIILAVLAAIAAGVIYLVFRPEKPRYSVTGVSIGGFNLTSRSPISPVFNVTVLSRKTNGKTGAYYEKGSAVYVHRDDIDLGNGNLPAFYQPAKNATLLKMVVRGLEIQLTRAMRNELAGEEKKGTVSFKLMIEAPLKFKVGSINTWAMSVKVKCEITVDKLTASSVVVNQKCRTDLHLW